MIHKILHQTKHVLQLGLTGAALWIFMGCSSSQNTSQSPSASTAAVAEQQYEFVPNFMQPVGGRQRNITGNYFIRVNKNKVEVDLPYIGKATQASPGSLDQGMKFVSTNFSYSSQVGKKGQNEITIEPKDVGDIQSIRLTAFNNGTGNVQINSVTRSAISYSGEMRAWKP
jgi:hypothetical protein